MINIQVEKSQWDSNNNLSSWFDSLRENNHIVGRWQGSEYSCIKVDDQPCFALLHSTKDMNLVRRYAGPREDWCEVTVVADFKPLKHYKLSKDQKQSVRDFCIYQAAVFVFDDMNYDGIVGRIRENTKNVWHIVQHINEGLKVPSNGERTKQGFPVYHWLYPKWDYIQRKSTMQKRAVLDTNIFSA